MPPRELRKLVGPTEPEPFDNPTGALVFPDVPEQAYAFVFDFGCGCGRLARQLIQQQPAPQRYIGVDPQRSSVEWCRANLTPHAPHFTFAHHDVFHEFVNPEGKLDPLPLPAPGGQITLFIAWSVFTHLLDAEASFYLRELARVLSPNGVAVTTWFLFDKRDFPMMQAFQNTLYISDFDPTNAVSLRTRVALRAGGCCRPRDHPHRPAGDSGLPMGDRAEEGCERPASRRVPGRPRAVRPGPSTRGLTEARRAVTPLATHSPCPSNLSG